MRDNARREMKGTTIGERRLAAVGIGTPAAAKHPHHRLFESAMQIRRICILTIGLSISLSTPLLLCGQLLHPDGPLPSFEVATIKPNNPGVPFMISPLGSQAIVHAVGTGWMLTMQAYNVPSKAQLFIGPGVADSKIYRIEARIPDEVFAEMKQMTSAERRRRTQLMLQSLLAERFGLRVHVGTKEMPVYELVIDKGGVKLPAPIPSSDGNCCSWVMSPKGEMRVFNSKLAQLLQNPIFGLGDRPIVNHTEFQGNYNFTLRWKPTPSAPAGVDTAAAPDDSEASIFTALREQLGLRLVPSRGPVEVLYVDGIAEPSEN
jgi:bla regulator protein BlaR1